MGFRNFIKSICTCILFARWTFLSFYLFFVFFSFDFGIEISYCFIRIVGKVKWVWFRLWFSFLWWACGSCCGLSGRDRIAFWRQGLWCLRSCIGGVFTNHQGGWSRHRWDFWQRWGRVWVFVRLQCRCCSLVFFFWLGWWWRFFNRFLGVVYLFVRGYIIVFVRFIDRVIWSRYFWRISRNSW